MISALPDEVLIKILKIMSSLCRVSKRWMRLCSTNCLWQIVAIDEWMIQKIDKHPMATIMSHAKAFTYFSTRNVTIEYLTVSFLRHLGNSSKLVYLDLSWQDEFLICWEKLCVQI